MEAFRLLARFGVDLLFASTVIFGVHQRLYRGREFPFTFFAFNVITFSLCVLLRQVPLEVGFALSVFAVFGMLRYRTETIDTRHLTYLFVVIGLGILNGVSNTSISFVELVGANVVITGAVLLELRPRARRRGQAPLLYDNVALLRPGQEVALRADVAARTGLEVVHVQINRFDMTRDAAELTVFYHRRDA